MHCRSTHNLPLTQSNMQDNDGHAHAVRVMHFICYETMKQDTATGTVTMTKSAV